MHALPTESGIRAGRHDSLLERHRRERARRHRRRARFGRLPIPPARGEGIVPYARTNKYLSRLNEGEFAALLINTRAWQETVKAYCDELDERTQGPRGPGRDFRAWEYEALVAFQWAAGLQTMEAARRALTSDAGKSFRYLVGMDYVRDSHADQRYAGVPEHKRPTLGLPSRRGLWAHRDRLKEDTARELWEECLRRLIEEHWEYAAFAEEARIALMDGIAVKSIFTGAVRDPETGEVVNADRVTNGFEGGAAMSSTLPRSKSGDGMLVVFVATVSRLALTVPVTQPMPGDEHEAARRLLRHEFPRTVTPYENPDPKKPSILVADGGFFEHALIRDIYQLGRIPQIHAVAHVFGGLKALGLNRDGSPATAEPDPELARAEASREDPLGTEATLSQKRLRDKLADTRRHYVDRVTARYPIKDYDGWFANGLYEIWCIHGHQATWSRYGKLEDGSAWSAVEGECEHCGSIFVQAGRWTISGGMLVPVLQSSEADRARAMWSVGNFLGYNDTRAARYGRARFAHMEGHLNNTKVRFAAFRGRNRSKTLDGVQIGVCAALSLQHAIAMHYRRCKLADAADRPLPEVGPVPDSIHWLEARQETDTQDPGEDLAA